MENVKHIVLVLSGKGGVGKSSVSSQLVVTLSDMGYKVGLLDIDLTGPSIPHIFNLETGKVKQSSSGWIPVDSPSNPNLKIMSLGFLSPDRGKSIVWRGPKKSAMIKQFINDVMWGNLDYLVIDTPPGTGDEHIAIATELQSVANVEGSVLVTTPQEVAAADVRKELNFSNKVNIKVLGVIENMSGYVCPHCSECTNIFSKGGGENLASKFNIPYLGALPLDPSFTQIVEQGDILTKYKETQVSKVCIGIVENLIKTIEQ